MQFTVVNLTFGILLVATLNGLPLEVVNYLRENLRVETTFSGVDVVVKLYIGDSMISESVAVMETLSSGTT